MLKRHINDFANQTEGAESHQSLEDPSVFVDDPWMAKQVGVAQSTIRGQRRLRKNGEPHWLTLDPVYFGKIPRYVREKAKDWLEEQANASTENSFEAPSSNSLPVSPNSWGEQS